MKQSLAKRSGMVGASLGTLMALAVVSGAAADGPAPQTVTVDLGKWVNPVHQVQGFSGSYGLGKRNSREIPLPGGQRDEDKAFLPVTYLGEAPVRARILFATKPGVAYTGQVAYSTGSCLDPIVIKSVGQTLFADTARRSAGTRIVTFSVPSAGSETWLNFTAPSAEARCGLEGGRWQTAIHWAALTEGTFQQPTVFLPENERKKWWQNDIIVDVLKVIIAVFSDKGKTPQQ